MTTYRIVHSTKYRFEHEVSSCLAEARLAARDLAGQAVRFHQLVVRPLAKVRREAEDAFGNRVTHLVVDGPLQTLEVTAINLVGTRKVSLPCAQGAVPWRAVSQALSQGGHAEALPYLQASPLAPTFEDLAAYAELSFPAGRPILAGAEDLMQRIHRDFTYDPRATTVSTGLGEVLAQRCGVCQDFAHLAVGCLRSLGLAARYVSGYVDSQPGPSGDRHIGGQASHAWFSVYVPEQGWVDFDPTNNRLVDEGYVTLAWGRDYGDVSPLRGQAEGGGRHSLSVDVDVALEDAESSMSA